MENENETLDSLNEENENADSSNGEEDVEALKAKLAETQEKNNKLFERAKQAEGFVKDPSTGNWVKKPVEKIEKVEKETEASKTSDEYVLTSEDIILLARQPDLTKEDIGFLKESAKLLKTDMAGVLANKVVIGTLKEKAEERKSAEVAHIGKTQKAVTKNDGEALLEAVEMGQLPADPEDVKKFAEARWANKAKSTRRRE